MALKIDEEVSFNKHNIVGLLCEGLFNAGRLNLNDYIDISYSYDVGVMGDVIGIKSVRIKKVEHNPLADLVEDVIKGAYVGRKYHNENI